MPQPQKRENDILRSAAMPVHNSEIAEIFSRLAELLEMQVANPFRIRAYHTATQTTEGFPNRVAGWSLRIFRTQPV